LPLSSEFAEWGFSEQNHPLDNVVLGRTMHAAGDWVSTQEAWRRGADTVASEIAHTRGPASAGGADHLA